jgi:hypothetical protein
MVGLTLLLATLGRAEAQEPDSRTPVPPGQRLDKPSAPTSAAAPRPQVEGTRVRPESPNEETPVDPALVDRLYADYCADEQKEKAKTAVAGNPDASGELSDVLRKLNVAADSVSQDANRTAGVPVLDKDVLLRPARRRFFDLHLGGQIQLDYSDTDQFYELRRR